MFKKFFVAGLLVTIFIFVGNQEKVSAYDVYCGNFSDGSTAYLMTESIDKRTGEDWAKLYCRVKAVNGNTVMYYVDYSFYASGGGVEFKSSQGYSGAFGGARRYNPYPFESNIFEIAYR